MHIAGKDQIW